MVSSKQGTGKLIPCPMEKLVPFPMAILATWMHIVLTHVWIRKEWTNKCDLLQFWWWRPVSVVGLNAFNHVLKRQWLFSLNHGGTTVQHKLLWGCNYFNMRLIPTTICASSVLFLAGFFWVVFALVAGRFLGFVSPSSSWSNKSSKPSKPPKRSSSPSSSSSFFSPHEYALGLVHHLLPLLYGLSFSTSFLCLISSCCLFCPWSWICCPWCLCSFLRAARIHRRTGIWLARCAWMHLCLGSMVLCEEHMTKHVCGSTHLRTGQVIYIYNS